MNNKFQLHQAMEQARVVTDEVFAAFAALTGRSYRQTECYESEDAEVLLLLLGSSYHTAKEAVDDYRREGKKCGAITTNLLRPFPACLLYTSYRQKDEYKINQISIGLLFLYLQKYTRMLDETQPTQYDDIMTMSVLRYIDQHYKTASLTELAKRINQPLSLLSRFIKAKTGATFKQLLQRKRMQVAATLLEDTKLSVSDISLAVGYENNSFFYRCFRDYYKVSPKEYRTENRK